MSSEHHLCGPCDGISINTDGTRVFITDTKGREDKEHTFDSEQEARAAVWKWREWLYEKYEG